MKKTNKKEKISCYIIGETSLTLQCAQWLVRQDHKLLGVVSSAAKIKDWAQKVHINHFDNLQASKSTLLEEEYDYLLSIANPAILKSELLTKPRIAAINYHDALLPFYAGVHATSWAIWHEEKEHAVTWHVMEDKVDAGAILVQKKVPIDIQETAINLNLKCHKTAYIGFQKLIEKLAPIHNKKQLCTIAISQDHSQGSYYGLSDKPPGNAWINWNQPGKDIERLYRATKLGNYANRFTAPKFVHGENAYLIAELSGSNVKINLPAGTVITANDQELKVVTQDQTIISITQLKNLAGLDCTLASVYAKENIKSGTQLTIPDNSTWNAYKELSEKLAKYEQFWLKEWKSFKPAIFPFLEVVPQTNKKYATYKLATTFNFPDNLEQALYQLFPTTNKQELGLALCAIYLYRLGNDEALGVALHQPFSDTFPDSCKPLLSEIIPLNLCLTHDMDFSTVLKLVQNQRQKLNQKKTYLCDLFGRYPDIQTISPPAITLSLEHELTSTKLASPLIIHVHSQKIRFLIAQEAINTDLQFICANIAEHLQTLLENIVQIPTQAIVQLPLLTTDERNKLLLEWNNTKLDYPHDKTIHQLFEEQVKKTPDNIALIFEKKSYTYKQLDEKANQIVLYLRAKGVTEETLVAVCLKRGIEIVITILAILKAGGTYICIGSDSPKERIECILQNAKPKITIVETKLGLNYGETEFNTLKNESRLIEKKAFFSFSHTNNIACIIYTSGSTGTPKGVEITHKGIIRLVKNTNYISLNEKDTIAQTSYEAFDAASFEIWGALLNGSKLIIYAKNILLDVKIFHKKLQENLVNTLWLTSALFNQFIKIQPNFFCHLKNLLIGGEPLNPNSIACLFNQKMKPKRILNGYGPTEATTFTTYYLIKETPSLLKSIPIGVPLANTQVYVLDKHKQLVPIGSTGELYIGGDGLARGYLNQPMLTQEKFIPNPFALENTEASHLYKTGDLVRWLPEGNLEYLGRLLDQQIKIRGFRVEIEEIEEKLNQHSLIEQAIVTVKVTENHDKQLVAYILEKVSKEQPAETLTSDAIQYFLQKSLPHYMIPSLFYKTEKFPITNNGKLARKQLTQADWPCTPLQVSKHEKILAKTPKQKQLLDLWHQLLTNREIGIHDNFFALGGDSILAMQLINEAQKHSLFFTVQDIFESPTIAQLADKAKEMTDTNAAQGIEQAENNLLFPLTPIQSWFFGQNFPYQEQFSHVGLLRINDWQKAKNKSEIALQNVAFFPSLYQKIKNKNKLKTAFETCLAHYSSFRLRFKKTDNGWQQYYSAEKPDLNWNEHSLPKESDLSEYIQTQQFHLQSKFNLEKGPLFGIQLILKEEDKHPPSTYLLIVIHHLIIDGVSWRILLQSLEHLYTENCSRLSYASANSFQQWSWALQQHHLTLPSRNPSWLKQTDEQAFTIPLDYEKGPNLVNTNQSIAHKLDAKLTRLLFQPLYTHYSLATHELLIALLIKTLADWVNSPTVALDLESHGRQEIAHNLQLSHVLGWYTSLYPAYFQIPQTGELIDSIQSIVRQLHSIPNGGIDYGVSRYLMSSNTGLLPSSPVNFNYWGQFQLFPANSPFHFEELRFTSHPDNSRIYLLAIEAMVNNGQLNMEWNYSENYHSKETIQHLVTRYFAQLEVVLQTLLNKEKEITKIDKPKPELSSLEYQEATNSLYIDTSSSYALSPMQKSFYFYGTANPGSEAYMVQLIWDLKPNINSIKLRSAFEKLIARHTLLRTYFQLEDSEPQQRVKSTVELPWQTYDWRGHSKTKIASLLQDDRKKSFKFSEPPLLRVALIQEDYSEADKQENFSAERRKMLITFHHILMDGWCLSSLLQELEQFYQALEQNTPVNLPTPVPYQQYIDWLQKQDLKAAKDYWKNYFQAMQSPATTCPLIQPLDENDPFASPDCCSQTFSLSLDLTGQLEQFLESNGITLNSFMQGLWGLLLHCYTGNTEVLSGATFSDRLSQTQIQPIMGLLINTLPLYLRFTENLNSINYFQQVQRQLAKMMRYSYTSITNIKTFSEQPADKLSFQTLVVTENYPQTTLTELGIQFKDIEIIDPTHYPLTLIVTPGWPLHIKFNYDAKRISTDNVRRLMDHLHQLCNEVINKKTQPLQQLHYLTPMEQQLLLEWNQTHSAHSPYQTVVEYFEQEIYKTKHYNAIAAVFGQEKITYKALNNKANQLAHYLIHIGVKPGGFVAIYLERSLDMLVGILATLKTGAAYVPLDPAYPKERIQYMIKDSGSQFVLSQTQLSQELEALLSLLTDVKTIAIDDDTLFRNQAITNIPLVHQCNTPMYLVYTSGSTGKPKAIQQAHQTIVNLISWQSRTLKNNPHQTPFLFEENSKSAQLGNFGFDVCVQEIFFSLLNGFTLYIIPEALKKSPYQLVEFILENQINQLFLPTAFLSTFCQAALQSDDNDNLEKWHALQNVIVAGEKLKLNQTSLDFFKKYKHIRLHNHYGPSETHVVTAYTLDNTTENWPVVPPIGKPIDNTQVCVLDKRGHPVPPLIIGELHISGIGAQGYLNQPKSSKTHFTNTVFGFNAETPSHNTGDLVYWSTEGCLHYIGRGDGQIKISGYRVELSEIEMQCEQHPQIERAAVTISTLKNTRQQLTAYLVPKPEELLSLEEIRQFLHRFLPRHMIPFSFITVSELPVTANGKVDKRQLVEMYQDSSSVLQSKVFMEPTSILEKQIAKLWHDILGISYQKLSVLDNFFDLGGDSLTALQLLGCIKNIFNIQLETTSLYEKNGATIQNLALKISKLQKQALQSHVSSQICFFPTKKPLPNCLIALKSSGTKPPLFLVHPVGGTIFWYLPLVKYWDPDRPLYAIQDPGIEIKNALPFQTVEEMAHFYVKAIQHRQPHGPYLLGGASAGATTSVEMALQLTTLGEKINFIGLLDGWAKYPDTLQNRAYFETGLRQQFEALKPQFLAKNIESADELLHLQWIRAQQNQLYLSNLKQKQKLRLTLFKASEQTPTFSAIEAPFNYWENVSKQPIEIHKVAGAHDTMFQEPHAKGLANTILQCLQPLSLTNPDAQQQKTFSR